MNEINLFIADWLHAYGIIQTVVGVSIGVILSPYITSYVNQKGKNRAAFEDRQSMDQLDIKKEQQKINQQQRTLLYNEFYAKLDNYHATNYDSFTADLPRIIGALFSGLVDGCQEKAYKDFAEHFIPLLKELNREFTEIVHESNRFKMFASTQVIAIYSNYVEAVKSANMAMDGFIKVMSNGSTFTDTSPLIHEQLILVTQASAPLTGLRDELQAAMRRELGIS